MTTERTCNLPPWAVDILESLPPLLDRAHAADVLNMSTRTLDRQVALLQIVAVRVGRSVSIPRRAVVDFLVRKSTTKAG